MIDYKIFLEILKAETTIKIDIQEYRLRLTLLSNKQLKFVLNKMDKVK